MFTISNRWAKALSVGAVVLASIAVIMLVTSIFSRGFGSWGMHNQWGQSCQQGFQGGCGKNQMMRWDVENSPQSMMKERGEMMGGTATYDMATPAPLMGRSRPSMMGGSVVSIEQKVATSASLDLRSKSLDWTVGKIREIAKNVGGFVENATVNQPEWGMKSAWLTIKVPADRFDAALAEMKQTADQVVNENMGAADMTAPYVDLSARISNKRAEEQAYENLLSNAVKVSDVLEITQQLTNVRTEIESLEQQLRYLDGETSLATISVSVTEDPQLQAKPGEFQRGNIFKAAINTLIDALIALGSGLVVFLITGLPILLIILGLLWLVYRVAKRGVDRLFGR